MRKGRKAKKLTKKDVLRIRDLWETGEYRQRELADKFDVSQQLISYIVNKEVWAWPRKE